MSALLVVDGNVQLRERLVVGLTGCGFALASASDGNGALNLLRARAIDLVVLEIELPNIDGISLIPLIRRITEVPIIMVGEKMDLATRIAALAAGADDCVTKPFDLTELAARINSALRRPVLRELNAIVYADLALDLATRDVYRGTHHIETTAREFDLLCTLARRPERVFTRTELIERVWGTERDVQSGTVETLISEVRAKIDRSPFPRLIQTIRGVGYALRTPRT